jgi:hypothetical protein
MKLPKLASANSNKPKTTSLGALNWFSIILLFFGVLIVLIFGANPSGQATIFIWMLACLLTGTFIGFLFGIPKVVQTNAVATANAGTATPANANTGAPAYQQQVNSNLTEISDWLTKIIVGLGLVNLGKFPPYLSAIANILAKGLVQPSTQPSGLALAFAYGTILCYATLGFLFGYITTRIYLAGAFSAADQNALRRIAENTDEIKGAAQSALQKAEFALTAPPVLPQQAGQSPDVQLSNLEQEYNNIRANLPSGDMRTAKMSEVVKGMMSVLPSMANFDISSALTSTDNGQRLTAYASLYIKPDYQYLDQLANAVIKDPTPFGQYWGILALGKVINLQPFHQLDPNIYNKLKVFHDQYPKGIDREYELRKVLQL